MDIDPRPQRVLDIGFGYGKYGLLCREYLTYWDDHLASHSREDIQIDGVEGFPEYVGDLQRAIYDRILVGDATQILSELESNSYDLVLAIDILEHMEQEIGLRFIADCQRVAGVAIISTPILFAEQEGKWGNQYEQHRSGWSKADLTQAGARLVLKTSNHIAIYAQNKYRSQFQPIYWTVRSWYRRLPVSWQERLSVDMPLFKSIYRRLRGINI